VNGLLYVCAVPDVRGLVPSVVYLIALTPDPPVSVELRVTVTGVLFHPAAFGAGEDDALVVGAAVSLRSASAPVALVLPARSAAVTVSVGDEVVPAAHVKAPET
jgi:hypothetical protein